MTDPESTLRASLTAIRVPHDDVRADAMIAAATAGSPLPARRPVLAPVAVAAAVAAIGTAAAVVAANGDDPVPTGTGPGVPSPREVVPVSVTYVISTGPSGTAFVPGSVSTVFGVSGSDPAPSQVALSTQEVGVVTIENPRGDRASVRLGSSAPVVTRDLAGRTRVSVVVDPVRTAAELAPTVQCREPGVGDRCRITVRMTTATRSAPTVDPSVSSTPSASFPEPPPAPTGDPGTSSPPSTVPSCPGCQIP